MTTRITLHPAHILHHHPYRETSVIVELFTQHHGRIAAVAKGIRKPNSRTRSLLQPFNSLLVSWQGKGDLKTLTHFEPESTAVLLQGDCLLSAFYLNELLVRLLQKEDPHPALYTLYHQTLSEFHQGQLHEKTLRIFEKTLLEELGYGLQLQYDFSTNQPFVMEHDYYFYPDQGFKRWEDANNTSSLVFSGKSLLAIAAGDWNDEILRDAKRLMRLALAPLLGTKPLHSRKLFAPIKEY